MIDSEFDSINETNDRIQRALNESKKESLREEFGMTFANLDSELDPEVEGDSLDFIAEFERQWKTQQQTTVWEFLGRPEIRPMEGLTTDEMKDELDRIYAIMDENWMALDCINDIEIGELYAFVSDQFMKTECSDMRVPEMTHRFIYEEFFPEKYPFDDSEWEGFNPVSSLPA